MSDLDPSNRCPCGTGAVFGECCGPFLSGVTHPPTAERLMRSRYTAYSVGDRGYLLATWHRSTRPASLVFEQDIRWLSLEILGRTGGGMLDTAGTVEFRAFYRQEGVRQFQEENSSLIRENRIWFYVDGVVA
jgi:SEC-C motif-containing protein